MSVGINGDTVTVVMMWRRRGCVGEQTSLRLDLDPQPTRPFVFEWHAHAESACRRFRIDGDVAVELEETPTCQVEPKPISR
jgi:hypothetical protein